MERLLKLVVVSFPVTMPSNGEDETNVAGNTENIVATTTVANSELTLPQINAESDAQSLQDYRSAASQTGQEENRDDGVFAETPKNPDDAAVTNQNTSSKSLTDNREVKSLCSVK